jgi:hypothetical protein
MSISNYKPLKHTFKSLVDRPDTYQIKNFDRVVVELGKYMTEFEMDQCIEFMDKIHDSKFDINPTVDDCKTQLQIMFGRDRVHEMIEKWSMENQKLLSVFGKLKYRNKKDRTDKTYYDGLDPTDNPDDYEKVYI